MIVVTLSGLDAPSPPSPGWWAKCESNYPGGNSCTGMACLDSFYSFAGKSGTSCLDRPALGALICRCSCIRRDLEQIRNVVGLNDDQRRGRLTYLADLVTRLDEMQAPATGNPGSVPANAWPCWPDSNDSYQDPGIVQKAILDIRQTALTAMRVDAHTYPNLCLVTYNRLFETSANEDLIKGALDGLRALIRSAQRSLLDTPSLQKTRLDVEEIANSPKTYTEAVSALATVAFREVDALLNPKPPGPEPQPPVPPVPITALSGFPWAKTFAIGLSIFVAATLAAYTIPAYARRPRLS